MLTPKPRWLAGAALGLLALQPIGALPQPASQDPRIASLVDEVASRGGCMTDSAGLSAERNFERWRDARAVGVMKIDGTQTMAALFIADHRTTGPWIPSAP